MIDDETLDRQLRETVPYIDDDGKDRLDGAGGTQKMACCRLGRGHGELARSATRVTMVTCSNSPWPGANWKRSGLLDRCRSGSARRDNRIGYLPNLAVACVCVRLRSRGGCFCGHFCDTQDARSAGPNALGVLKRRLGYWAQNPRACCTSHSICLTSASTFSNFFSGLR